MGTTKISHIRWCIDFLHKVLHGFQIERSDIQVVSIMSWLFVNSFVISLDWTIHFNLDFVLKSFRCSKGDVWDVFCLQLYEMNPQNCRRKKLDDEVMENWHRRYGEWIGMWQQWLVIFFSVFTFRSARLTYKYIFIYTVFLEFMMIPSILWAYKVRVYILPMNEFFLELRNRPPPS